MSAAFDDFGSVGRTAPTRWTPYCRPEVVSECLRGYSQRQFATRVTTAQNTLVTQSDLSRMLQPIRLVTQGEEVLAEPSTAVDASKLVAFANYTNIPFSDLVLPPALNLGDLTQDSLLALHDGFKYLRMTRLGADQMLPYLLSDRCEAGTTRIRDDDVGFHDILRRLIDSGYGRQEDFIGYIHRQDRGYGTAAAGLSLAEIGCLNAYAALPPEDRHLRFEAGERLRRRIAVMRTSFWDFLRFFKAENESDSSIASNGFYAIEMSSCLHKIVKRADIRTLCRLGKDTDSRLFRDLIRPWMERQIEQHTRKMKRLLQETFTFDDVRAICVYGVDHRDDFARLLARLTAAA